MSINTSKVLIICDMENELCIREKDKAYIVIPLIKKRLDYYRKYNYQIIYIMDVKPDKINKFECQVVDELKPLLHDIIIYKPQIKDNIREIYSSMFKDSVIEIVGLYTEFCVYWCASIFSNFCKKVNVILKECIGLNENMISECLNNMKTFANII